MAWEKLYDRRNILKGVAGFFTLEILQRSLMRFISEQKRSPENRKGIKEFKAVDVNGVKVDIVGVVHTLGNLETNYYDFLKLIQEGDVLLMEGSGTEGFKFLFDDELADTKKILSAIAGIALTHKTEIINVFRDYNSIAGSTSFFNYLTTMSLRDNSERPVYVFDSKFTQLQILYTPALVFYGLYYISKLRQNQKVTFWEIPVIATLATDLKEVLGGLITLLFGPDKELSNEQLFDLAINLVDYRDALLATLIHSYCRENTNIKSGKRLKVFRGLLHAPGLYKYLQHPDLARAALLKYPQFRILEKPDQVNFLEMNSQLKS